jgi:ubiquinone/menaquinone biosynthesis C-methylase UbiE
MKGYNKELALKYKEIETHFYKENYDTSREALYKELGEKIQNKKLLDLGCGFGYDLKYYENLGYEVYGIDASETMIELAENKKNLFVKSMEKTDFENDFFDVVISRHTLHYAEDIEPVFKEVNRILKKEGKFVFLVDHPLNTFMKKSNKYYYKPEKIKSKIYNEKVEIEYYAHKFTDYLCPYVFENFKVLNVIEGPKEKDFKEPEKYAIPYNLIIKLEKI